MLCLLDDALDLDTVVRNPLFRTKHPVLFIPAVGHKPLAACRSGDADLSLPFDRWVQKFSKNGILRRGSRVSLNQVLLVWRRPDDRLQAVLAALQGLTDTRIEVAILLVGPLDADEGALFGLVSTCQEAAYLFLSNIWYLGNGSHSHTVFAPVERRDAVRRLVHVLLSENNSFADRLGIFRGEALLLDRQQDYASVTASETFTSVAGSLPEKGNVFFAFGLRSWEPWPDEFDSEFVRRLAGTVLRCEEQVEADRLPAIRKTMTDAADTLLSTLASLGTPYDLNAHGKSPQSFQEQLPMPPAFDLDSGECPVSREYLQPILEQALAEGYEPALLGYRAALMDALPGISQKIRRNGRHVFVQGLKDFRQLVAETGGLLEMRSLLNDFFPRLMKSRSALLLIPPEPASVPNASTCRAYSVEAQAFLAAACNAMPSEKSIRVLRLLCGALAFTPALVYLFREPWPWFWIPVPAVCGAFIIWAAGVHSRRIARHIIDSLQRRFRADGQALRAQYIGKLEWILKKTQCAVENQLVGELSATGRKLALNYEHFYATGIVDETEKASTTRIVDMMTARGIPREVADQCRIDIENAVSLMVEDAMKEGAPSVGRTVAQELLEKIAARLNVSVVVPRPTAATVKDEFMTAAGRKEQPPIPAVLPPGEDSSHFARYYLLPDAYYEDSRWRLSLPHAGGHNILSSVLQAHSLKEPMMISLRTALNAREAAASLTTTGGCK